MAGDSLISQDAPLFDASQFKLQDDGTFRISIRGMAAMAGVDDGGLARSLKTAADEKTLPCARSLLAQGFYPADVSTWGETGGIPEEAAPFILEHYAFTAAAPSQQARAVLLAFSRVGINAYLKDKLGVRPRPEAPAPVALPDPIERAELVLKLVDTSLDLLDRLGGADERERMVYRDLINNTVVRGTGNLLLPAERKTMTLAEAFIECGAPPHQATKFATKLGRAFKELYRRDHDGQEPRTHKQIVRGRECNVADYEAPWVATLFPQIKQWLSELMQ
jgi:hypothetical protein